ncbi:hypothetical protein V6N13_085972 [Hibiscus sabdariffa]|uniref:Large ribosomal subunit protein mL54 n=1 Tax=Hibiscus sabdariffa TaxID=183260 RepID=A0ABR2FRS5_9ROSI
MNEVVTTNAMPSIVDTIHVYRGSMALVHIRSLRSAIIANEAVRAGQRTFAAGAGKAKKGSKGAAGNAPKASILSKEVKSTAVIGANILKDGADQKILSDPMYPD